MKPSKKDRHFNKFLFKIIVCPVSKKPLQWNSNKNELVNQGIKPVVCNYTVRTDLDRALNENLIFGAGIDVFEKEPPNDNNPLLKNEKVFLSPHTASFTEECMTRMGIETIQNIIDFFDNKLEESKIVKL